jgi:DNA-binding GntR family transcriptional regulator
VRVASSSEDLPDVFKGMRLERQSTPTQITEVLEGEILNGALKPGERLRETQLAEMFGVSRNTLREALRVLEREGLIRHIPHRGAEVTKLTEDDVADLYAARLVLERAGVQAAIGSAEAIAALRKETEDLEKAGKAGDRRTLLEHDFAFHRLLVDQLGSTRLDALFVSLQRELRLALSQLDSFDPMPQVDEHREILEALADGRSEEAEQLLSRHLEVARDRVSEMTAAEKEPSG